MKSNNKQLLAVLVSIFSLSGCSVLTVGEEPEYCGVDGKGINCVSAREVWAATDTYDNLHGMTKDQVQREARKNDPASGGSFVEQESKSIYSNNVGRDTQKNKPLPASERAEAFGRFQEERLHLPSPDPLAVREVPGILRITIAPYIDATDRVNFPSQVFAEVEKRTWTIGIDASKHANRVTPTALRATSKVTSETNLDQPMDSGMGINSRLRAQEMNLEGIVPTAAPTLNTSK